MKKAVIVLGPHFSGKSKTINKYFKHLIGLSEKQRKFTLKSKPGTVLSQSLEEKKLGYILSQSVEEKRLSNLQDFLGSYLACHWLVLAARPREEDGSHYESICTILKRNGFSVHTVVVKSDQPESFYKDKGKEIYAHLV